MRTIYEGISMLITPTTPIRRIEEALIQLQYALCDYYICGEQNRDPALNSLEAPLYGLRVNLNSALSAISRFAEEPEIVSIQNAVR